MDINMNKNETENLYKAILKGAGLDEGFAGMLSETDRERAAIVIKSMIEAKTTSLAAEAARNPQEPILSPEEQEKAALRQEIESIMFKDWRGTPAADSPEASTNDPIRQEVESIMLYGRGSRGYKPDMEANPQIAEKREPLVHGVRT